MVFVAAVIVALLLVPVVSSLLRRVGSVDIPGSRSSHTTTAIRGGGVVIVAILAITMALVQPLSSAQRLGIILGTIGPATIGMIDDVSGGLRPLSRLTWTIASAAAAVALVLGLSASFTTVVVVLIATFWVASSVNAFNFMDGIDGISALHGVVIGLFFALVGSLQNATAVQQIGLALAGASLGFLPYNLRRSKVFLGDVGAYGMGGCIGIVVVLCVKSGIPVEACIAAFVPYLADTGTTLLRRSRRRERLQSPHREHTYQRLTDQGLSHIEVACLVAAISTGCGFAGLLSLVGLPERLLGAVLVVALSLSYLALPRLLSTLTSRRGAR